MGHISRYDADAALYSYVCSCNFGLRLCAWEYLILFYFIFNKIDYAWCRRYYLKTIKNYNQRYPGLKEMLKDTGIYLQGQDLYPM